MRKLFYLLLALPLVFVACNDPEEPKIEEAVLTLTSEAEMTFEAEGGEGIITFTAEMKELTRYEPVPEPVVVAMCEADWVTNLTVEENITFTVLANEGDARETKIVVEFDDKSFEVAIKQAAKGEDPKPEPSMDIAMAAAARIPSSELDLADNYFALAFTDDAENVELGIVLVGAEGETILQAGDYASNNDTLLAEACEVFVWDPAAAYTFVEGAATVGLEGENYTFDIELADEAGALYHFTYEGVVLDMVPTDKPAAENFVPVMVTAYRSSNWDLGNFELSLYINDVNYHSLDMQDNINPNDGYLTAGHYSMEDGSVTSWSNFLHDIATGEGAYVVAAEIDLTHNEDGTSTIKGFFESEYGVRLNIDWTGVVSGFDFNAEVPAPGGDVEFTASFFGGEYYSNTGNHNYYFVLSDVDVSGDTAVEGATYYYFDLYSDDINDNLIVPNGVYTYDPTDSFASGTFSSYYSYGFVGNESGGAAKWYLYAEGSTVTVTDNKIVAELILEDGTKHTVTYEGEIAISEVSNMSGLEGDIELNLTGADIYCDYYGQYYNDATDNYMVQIFEDADTGNGKYILLELLADYATAVDQSGTYTGSSDYGVNTFISGYLDDNYLMGCWYAELTEGEISGVMAPITEGTITITLNNGTQTYTFDCVDDQGHKITGSVTGTASSAAYSALSASKSQPAHHGLQLKKSLVF